MRATSLNLLPSSTPASRAAPGSTRRPPASRSPCRFGRRATAGHRPDLPRPADLAGRPVVQRRRRPGTLAAGARHRRQRPDRLPGGRALPRLSAWSGRATAGPPSSIYVRKHDHVAQVQALLAPTATPRRRRGQRQPALRRAHRARRRGRRFRPPVPRPRRRGAVVGAVGVANIMIISVLERRSEIGQRRALGATRSQIRTQFLGESILLAAIGGSRRARRDRRNGHIRRSRNWDIVIPVEAWTGGSPRPSSSADSPVCCPPFGRPGWRPPWPCERSDASSGRRRTAHAEAQQSTDAAAGATCNVPVQAFSGRRSCTIWLSFSQTGASRAPGRRSSSTTPWSPTTA